MDRDRQSDWREIIESEVTREYFLPGSPTESTQSNHSSIQEHFAKHQINFTTGQPNTSTPYRNTMSFSRASQFRRYDNSMSEFDPILSDNQTMDEEQQEQQRQQEPQEQQEQREQQENTIIGDGPQQDMLRILNALNQNLKAISQRTPTTITPTSTTGTGTGAPTPPRETKLVDLPTFKGGEQDPLIWLEEFEDICVANRISDEQKIEIVLAYLKGIVHS
jgi:hypothetical protein